MLTISKIVDFIFNTHTYLYMYYKQTFNYVFKFVFSRFYALAFDLVISYLFRKRQLDSVFRYEPKIEIKLNATKITITKTTKTIQLHMH